jgi:DNA-binding transcriptional LysR family regulator
MILFIRIADAIRAKGVGTMLLAQVEGFLEVARLGHLGRAATGMFISQPTLTARLHALEAELGTPLFDRSRRGMALTDAGRGFLPYAERAAAALREGREVVAGIHRGVAGELTIGTAPAVGTYVLPQLLARFAELHPNVRLVVRTGHSEEIIDLVVRREVALGLIRELHHPLLETTMLYQDELVLVAPPNHPFARASRIPVERMAETRLILFDRTSSYYDLTNAIVRAAGIAPLGVMELDNIDAAKQMVGQGLGVALLPMTAVANELSSGELRSIVLDGVPPITRKIVAVRRRDAGRPSTTLQGFLDVIGEIDAVLPRVDATIH